LTLAVSGAIGGFAVGCWALGRPSELAFACASAGACSSWLTACSPARLALLRPQVAAARDKGASFAWVFARSGAGIGCVAFVKIWQFAIGHAAAAVLGTALGSVPDLSTGLLCIPWCLVVFPTVGLVALAGLPQLIIVGASSGLVAGILSGARFTKLIASPPRGVGWDAAVSGMSTSIAAGVSLAGFQAPLRKLLYMSPFFTAFACWHPSTRAMIKPLRFFDQLDVRLGDGFAAPGPRQPEMDEAFFQRSRGKFSETPAGSDRDQM